MQKVLKIAVVLLVVGSSDARPQTSGADSTAQLATSDAGWRGVLNKSHDTVRDNSSGGQPNVTHRDLKDLQYMDQSLRTVATQLLNVTDPQDVVRKAVAASNKEHAKPESSKVADKPSDALIREVNSEISNLESMGVSFGRPINSKFSYFETSHPGQAMAMTEEELEREMSTTRLMTAYKNHPTTSGGISTWILLNPPSTTAKSADAHERTKLKQPFQTEVRLTVRPNKVDTMADEKPTVTHMTPVLTAEKVVNIVTKKPTTSTLKKVAMTSARPTMDKSAPESTSSATTLKMVRVTTMSTSPSDVAIASPSTTTTTLATTTTTTTTTKKTQGTRATSKSKVTTPRTTKPTRSGRPKPTATRRTTLKLETVRNDTASTGKIEKVTFKPVHIITTTTTQRTDKPMFVTRIKASVLMDGQKVNPATTPTSPVSSTSKSTNLSSADVAEVPVRSKPIGTKVQPKKPEDGEPMKVNALKIQKVDRDKLDEIVKEDTDDELSNSRIDLKFDFNPELTKINVETEAASSTPSTTTTAASSTTTKRPRHNSKRKKNKGRRRKPSTTTTTTTTVATSKLTEMSDEGALVAAEDAIQESKILPETKVAPNATRIKKKQPPKAISTQIYNFLSREVMPSFGVMSLVGLGLGLASYFLYPFGGTITRRNYDTEPNYKYNLDEYGGSYGQSEEEVLSKVLQGMTTSHAPAAKNHAADYYRYQHYDGAYDAHTTKRMDQARYPSTSPIYRPDNAQQAIKYRNTRYPSEAHATTPVHLAELAASANRQFVVGSVPKEYSYELPSVHGANKGVVAYGGQLTDVDRGGQAYGHQRTVEASTVGRPSADDGYDEEMEITPTAVAVEHGPRALRVKRAAVDDEHGSRQPLGQRESVIQVIPSKRELEQERKQLEEEEDLSNEILDIIDSALPGGQHKPAKDDMANEVEDLEGQEKKRQEEANTRIKQSTVTMTSDHVETSDDDAETWHTTSSPRDTTTVEWFESTTTKKPAEGFSLFDFVKKVAEIKFRLGLTILKHASESFARYLGHVQKRINGDE